MGEDTNIGGVTWHSSEEGNGPDVGISIYLGPDDRLWAGEISSTLFENAGGPLLFDGDGGWFLVRHRGRDDSEIIAKFADDMTAREFMEQVSAWVRAAHTPMLAMANDMAALKS